MAGIAGKSVKEEYMGELFIYKCKSCGQTFELFHLLTEPVHEIKCPECGGTEASRLQSYEHKGALPKKAACKKEDDKGDE